ncbi:MAG: hypothetical protein K0Q93_3042 [Nocardioidaceae bacterium]|jgi:hypothetical protein|nr:hypothetical protein [Nocardioidaceae bacterium]
MIGWNARKQFVDERGPRYLVEGTIRRDEFAVTYADTAEQAEKIRDRYENDGYRNIKVHLPDLPGMEIDLARYGRELAAARREVEEATAIVRAAVIRAAEQGRAEAEIARTAGVDRMTVRKWVGK